MGIKRIETNYDDRWWLKGSKPVLWFFLLSLILWGQTIWFDYTYLDDQTLILEQISRLTDTDALKNSFSEDVFHADKGKGFYYRPLLTISFIIDTHTGNGDLKPFHVTNILLHFFTTILLFFLLLELGFDRGKSFVISLIFICHPMVTQVIAWIPGRNDSLLALFILAAFIFLIRYFKTSSLPILVVSFGFYILALFTKENAIVFPLLAILLAVGKYKRPAGSIFIYFIITGIITGIWLWLRKLALGENDSISFLESVKTMIINAPALIPYIGKSMFPFDLSVLPIMRDMEISFILGIIAIAAIILFLIQTKNKRISIIIFSITWFILFLVPTFQKLTSQYQNFSEHRIYLSLIGFLMLLAECSPTFIQKLNARFRTAMIVVILILFSLLSFFHSRNFSSKFAFWTNAVMTSPSNAFNYNNLGAMYFLDANLDSAMIYFKKAVAINPTEPMANGNIGLIYMRQGNDTESEQYYLKEISVNPLYDNVHYNLGLLHFNNKKIQEALSAWEKTIQINPYYSEAYQALLYTYDSLKMKDDYLRIIHAAEKYNLVTKNQ